MPSEAEQKKNRKKMQEQMEKIPAPIPGSSSGIFGMVMRKLSEVNKSKQKDKKAK